MEQNNNNNPNQNFNSPERVGVSREYVNRRVFGESFHENNNRDEAEAQLNNNLAQNNEFPVFARGLNFDNLQDNRMNLVNRFLNFPNLIRNQNSTVAGSDYRDSSIDSGNVSVDANRSNHFLSEASNSSDIEGLSFSDYEERFPELGNSSIEPKIVKKVKSDSRSK